MHKTIKSTLLLTILGLLGFSGYLLYANFIQTKPNTETNQITVPPIKNPEIQSENPNINNLLNQAEQQINNKQFNQALQTYIQIYNLDKSSNLALIGIANVYYQNDKIDLAMQNLANAEKKQPLNYQAKILQLKLNLVKQNLQTASRLFNEIPDNTNEKLLLGSLINILNGNLEQANNYLNTIINGQLNDQNQELAKQIKSALDVYKTFTDSPKSYLFALVGQKLIDNNQPILARPLLFASIQDKNDYRDSWLMLGYSYLLGANYTDATKALEKAKQIDPYSAEVYFYLGLAQQKNNQPESSVDNLKRANSFGFRSTKDNLLQIANSLYLDKKYTEANEYFNRANQEGVLNIEDYTKMVWLNLEQLNNPEKGLEISLKALTEYPTTAMANNLVGWSQISLGNFEEANKYLNLALEINPNFEAAYLNLGLLSLTQKNPEQAKTYLQKALDLAKENRAPSIQERAQTELNKLNTPNT